MKSRPCVPQAMACAALLLFVLPQFAAASDPVVLPSATPTLVLNRGSGYAGDTPMEIAYVPAFDHYYGALGGSESFSGFTFDAAGNLIQTRTPINVDVRSMYFNPNTGGLEVVTYGAVYGGGPYGLFRMGLDGAGLLTGSNSLLLAQLPGLVDDQTMPAYDPARNRYYSRSMSPMVNIVSRVNGALLGTISLDLSPAGFPQLLGFVIGFDPDFDVLITVDPYGYRALVNRPDGSFIGACALPPFTSSPYYSMGYSNGQLFVFDEPSNSWHGYRLFGGSVDHNHAPDCSQARPSVDLLWPPNHLMVPVQIDGITDADSDTVQVEITRITQDEPVNGIGDGSTAPDADGIGTPVAYVRAERTGSPKAPGNGRVYQIEFTASDGHGGECSGAVQVCVPHNGGDACYDDGRRYDSRTGGPLAPRASVPRLDAAPLQGGPDGGVPRVLDTTLNPAVRAGRQGKPQTVLTGGIEVRVDPKGGALRYSLPAPADVHAALYDLTGREVALLGNSRESAGEHQLRWNSAGLSQGIYFVRIRAGASTTSRAVLVTR